MLSNKRNFPEKKPSTSQYRQSCLKSLSWKASSVVQVIFQKIFQKKKYLRCPLAKEAVTCHLQAFHNVHFRDLEEASFHTVSSLSLYHLIYCIKISLCSWQLRTAAYHSRHTVQWFYLTFLVPFVSSIQLFSVLPWSARIL